MSTVHMTHRIPKEIAEKIDLLIEEGHYKSKSQVIINGIQLLLEKHNLGETKNTELRPMTSLQQINTPDLNNYYKTQLIFDFMPIIKIDNPIPVDDLVFTKTDLEYVVPSEIMDRFDTLLILRKFEHLKANGIEPRLEDTPSPKFVSLEKIAGEKLKIEYGMTSFFKTLATNYSSDVFVVDWTQTLRRKYLTITDFEENKFPFSDQIGTGTIFISKDNYLILGKRSGMVIESPGKITHSVGGFADLVNDTIDDKFHIRDTVYREAREELGIESSEIKNLKLIGVGRDLKRGGLPDFQFLGQLSINYDEVVNRVKGALDAWETTNIIGYDLNNLPATLEDFLMKLLEMNIHSSLGFGISCWLELLSNDS